MHIRLILWCILISIAGFAQQSENIDLFKEKLKNAHTVPDKIDIYIRMSEAYQGLDLDTAEMLARDALLLARQINATEKMGKIHIILGEIFTLNDDIAESKKEFLSAIEYLEQTDNKALLVEACLGLGNKYVEVDDNYNALNYYLRGINIAEEYAHEEHLSNLYNNSGVVYLRLKNYERSLELFSKAFENFEKNQDTTNMAGTTSNIGSIYTQLGNFNIAKDYYVRSFELFKAIGNNEGMAHALMKLGLLAIEQGNYRAAQDYLLKSQDFQEELEVTIAGSKSIFAAETKINLGIVFLKQEKENEAIRLLKEGFELANQTGQLSLIVLSADYLSQAYEKLKDPGQALEYFKIYKSYSDSLFNEENVRKITQLEMQHLFDLQMKEKRVEELRQKRQNLLYIIVSGGLLSLLLVAFLLLKLEKNKKRKIELERKSLKDELDFRNKELATHVLYNLRKSEMIISISEKLKKARLDAKTENKKILGEIIAELKSSSGKDEWKEFEIRFKNVYTGFYKNLSDKFPDLTPNELRLCAFLRLNMTTKDIAAITYQSHNSIDTARFRLRKKLGLSKDDNLITFLARF